MAKHIEQTQQTKEKLVNAFWELYCENKIEKITIKAITDKAGYYRSTFYEYFSDVYELLDEIEKNLLIKHRSVMEKICTSKDFSHAKELGFGFCKENAEVLAVLLGPNGDPKFFSTIKEHILRCIKEILHVNSDSKEIQIAIEIISGSVVSVLTYWYQHQDTVELQELFNAIIGFVKHGAVSLVEDLNIPFLQKQNT